MTTVANHEACFGYDCERKQGCLRHVVLRGNVPCFPIADNLCGGDKDACVHWDESDVRKPVAVPSLFQ